MTAQRIRATLAGLLAIGLLAGCFGRGQKPEFYALSAHSGTAAGAAVAALPDLGLTVGPLEIPRYLDRPEIVRRDGSNRLVLANAHRWGGSLRNDILRVVAVDLGRLLGTARVSVYPAAPQFPARYGIVIDLREFESVAGDRVLLHAVWSVVSVAEGNALAVEESRIETPVATPEVREIVAAQSAALGSLSRAIAERVADLAAAGAK